MRTWLLAFLMLGLCGWNPATQQGGGTPDAGGGPPDLPEPISAWDFNENTASTAADKVGSNDGTLTGAVWTTSSKYGTSAVECRVGETSDSVDVPDDATLDITGDYTMMLWVYPLDVETTWTFVMGKLRSSGADDPPYTLNTVHQNLTNNPPYAFVYNGAVYNEAADSVAISQDTWTHLAVAYDSAADTLTFYVDGSEVDSQATNDATVNTTSGDFQFCENDFNGQEFEGRIDDARIYGEVLTEQQINDAKDNEDWI